MATVRIMMWAPHGHLAVTASSERTVARMAEAALIDLAAARRGAVAFWIDAGSPAEKSRLLEYVEGVVCEIKAEARLRGLTPLDREPDGLIGEW